FTTRPKAPSALCWSRSTTVWVKYGSRSVDRATRKAPAWYGMLALPPAGSPRVVAIYDTAAGGVQRPRPRRFPPSHELGNSSWAAPFSVCIPARGRLHWYSLICFPAEGSHLGERPFLRPPGDPDASPASPVPP